tara:strand:+ start:1629 stop:2141 length:513 start_codon:yes stop_codon:yes gene_type:complete
MTVRTIIDPAQSWGMRVSTPGKDVLTDGGPYLFDGSLETMNIHQSGIVTDIFQWQQFNTPSVHRCIKPAGAYASYPELVISFPALAYVPHIEWGITSDDFSATMDFPGRHTNKVNIALGTGIINLPVAMIPSTSSFKLIGTTKPISAYGDHGGEARQGDLYYTVFKRPTT